MFLIDGKENVVAVNAIAFNVFLYSGDDMTGRAIHDFITLAEGAERSIPPEEVSESSAASFSVHKDTGHLETSCRRKDGTTFIAQVSVIPSGDDNRKLVVIQNISDRKKIL